MHRMGLADAVTSARRADEAPGEAIALLQAKAAEAARLMRMLANENRLLLLCHLAAVEEMGAGALAEALGLSPSAASQHLALLREDGLLATRREAQAVFYRIADPKVARLLGVLRELYCPPEP